MLNRLLETGARPKKAGWGGVASVIVHGTIIGLAIAATASARPAPTQPRENPPIITFNPRTPTARDGQHGGTSVTTSTAPRVPRLPNPGTPVDIDVPVIPTPDPGTAGSDTTLLRDIGTGSGQGTGAVLGGTGIATDATVDVPVRVIADRVPAYPEMLRSAGISGSVIIRFVVDTTGRAELSTVRVVESSHQLFTQSALAALRQARFTPGELAGHRVRTLVERSYRFDIAGSER
jgi:protein TonB